MQRDDGTRVPTGPGRPRKGPVGSTMFERPSPSAAAPLPHGAIRDPLMLSACGGVPGLPAAVRSGAVGTGNPGPAALQHALGRRDVALARVELDGLPERARKRLEDGLDRVVGVPTAADLRVEREAGVLGERTKEALDERGRERGALGQSPPSSARPRPEMSTEICASASSIGTEAKPKRRMPFRSPSAPRRTLPRTIPTSSTV